MGNAKTPAQGEPTEFGEIWMFFTKSVRPYLVPVPDDRTLDQFLGFRDRAYKIIQDPKFVSKLEGALILPFDSGNEPELEADYRAAILEELRACTRAAEVLQSTEPMLTASDEGRKKSRTQLLTKFSTTLGSLKDSVSEMPYVKAGVGLFKEAVDFFK